MGSSSQRMKADNKRAGKKGSLPKDQQFVQMINSFRQEPAWRALNYGARCLYIEIKSLHTGLNNGRIMCSVRHAVALLQCSHSSAERFLKELQDKGFIVEMKRGVLGVDGHGAGTLWRLTELGCPSVDDNRPTKNYRNWKPAKNKTPSLKSGRSVPKIGTGFAEGVPKIGTGCP